MSGTSSCGVCNSSSVLLWMAFLSVQLVVSAAEVFTNQFVMEVKGGPLVAQQLAAKHGFHYLAHVSVLRPARGAGRWLARVAGINWAASVVNEPACPPHSLTLSPGSGAAAKCLNWPRVSACLAMGAWVPLCGSRGPQRGVGGGSWTAMSRLGLIDPLFQLRGWR